MYLITGGLGFIGIHLLRALHARGEKVRVLDCAAVLPSDTLPGVEYITGDIRDENLVKKACEGVERIFHIVALVPIAKAGKRYWEVNVTGTRHLLEGALIHKVKKVVYVSSSAVYDLNQPQPITEQSRILPVGKYGRSKLAAENVCLEYRRKGIDVTIIRPRTVVGKQRLGIFQILFDWISQGKHIYIIGSGANKIQFIHVQDLACALISAMDKATNEVFNIGSDRYQTLRQDLESLIAYAHTSSKVCSISPGFAIPVLQFLDTVHLSPLADWHYLTYHKNFFCDMSKAYSMLNWHPQFSNSEMLIEAYQWYVDNREQIRRQAAGTTHRKSVKQQLLGLLRDVS